MKTSIRVFLTLAILGLAACSKNVPIETIKIPETLSLYVDSTYTLECTFTPADATSTINWCSSNDSVASVNDKGVVLAKSQGQTIVTAQSGDKISACQVTVYNNPVVLELTVLDIAQKTCTVSVAASDEGGYYYCGYAEKAEIAGLSDEQITTAMVAYINQLIQAYKNYGYNYTMKDFLQQGSKNLIASGLTANTQYTMFAFGIDVDNEEMTSVVTREDFKTKAVVPSSNTFTITYDSLSATGTTTITTRAWFTITPSVEKDKYAVQTVSVNVLDSLYGGDAMTYMQAAEEYYNTNYPSYGGMDATTTSGTQAVSMKNPVVGTTYRMIVAGYDAGFTTGVTTYDWTFEESSAPARRSVATMGDDSRDMKAVPCFPFVKGACYPIKK